MSILQLLSVNATEGDEATMSTQKARGTQQRGWPEEHTHRQLPAFRQQTVPLCHDTSCWSLPTDTGPTQKAFWGSLWGTCPGAQVKMSTGSAYPHLTRKGLLSLAPPPASKTNDMSVTLVTMAQQLPQKKAAGTPHPLRPFGLTISQTLGTLLLRKAPKADNLWLPEPGALQMGFRFYWPL